MFSDFLRANNPELYSKTISLGINLSVFEGIYQIGERHAIKALQDVVSEREKEKEKEKNNQKPNHIEQFMESNKKDLQQLIEIAKKVKSAIEVYNTENNTVLKLDLDAQVLEDIIYLGRVRRDPAPQRDMRGFASKAKKEGYSSRLRIRASDEDDFEYAELNKNGTINAGSQTYKRPKEWAIVVYSAAVERGTRNTRVGSPWKGIQIRDRFENWVTLDKAYKHVMGEAEVEDDE